MASVPSNSRKLCQTPSLWFSFCGTRYVSASLSTVSRPAAQREFCYAFISVIDREMDIGVANDSAAH